MFNDNTFLNNHLEYPCINDGVCINNEDYQGINEIDSVEDENDDYNSNIEFIEIENSQYNTYEVSKENSNNIYNHFREISDLQFLKESQSEDNISDINLNYINQYTENKIEKNNLEKYNIDNIHFNNSDYKEQETESNLELLLDEPKKLIVDKLDIQTEEIKLLVEELVLDDKSVKELDVNEINVEELDVEELDVEELVVEDNTEEEIVIKELYTQTSFYNELDVEIKNEIPVQVIDELIENFTEEALIITENIDNLFCIKNEIDIDKKFNNNSELIQQNIADKNESNKKNVKFNLEIEPIFHEKICNKLKLEKELIINLNSFVESEKKNIHNKQLFKNDYTEPILLINEIKNEYYNNIDQMNNYNNKDQMDNLNKYNELESNFSETDLESTYDNLQITRLNNHLNSEIIDFDWKQYILNYNDLKLTGVDTQEKAWNHWINNGKFEGRSYLPLTNNKKKKINKSIDQISSDFDWKQYVQNYNDLQETGVDTLEKAWIHWIYHGKFEGRTYFPFQNKKNKQIKKYISKISSDSSFDWKQYVQNYKDLDDIGIDSLEKAWNHWVEYGENEGRTYLFQNSYKFDWNQYILNYKDLQESGINTFEQAWYHWENYGEMEGRTYLPIENILGNIEINNDYFDWQQYILNYKDLQESGVNSFEQAWYHWINHGQIEGRTYININNNINHESNIEENKEFFDWEQYILNYYDLQESGLNTFEQAWYHWINHGKIEGTTYKNLDIEYEYNIDKEKEEEEKNFNWKQYIKNYIDLQEMEINNFEKAWSHWINHGKKEGRKYHNFYEEEIIENYNNKIDLISYNNINIKFKPKYDRYGIHYYGWKGVINNFIQWFCESNKNKSFKYKIFFDEWIEKLLLWGNKIINESYLKEIKNNYYKVITFIHNPPFTQLNDEKYKNKIKKEVIINNDSHFNDNLYNEIEKNGILDNLMYVYVLSNNHKDYMYNKYPKLQNKLLSVHHAIDLQTDESKYFDINEFMNNKKIYNIGWWLRNFKTFIDFKTPKYFKKYILVKDDFLIPFNNDIVANNDMSNIEIVNEVTNDEYSSIFKNSIIFADIVDCIANNTILECIKFNTPIIVRRNKSAEEYLGINYPLFFSDYSELVYLKEESFLLDLIFESHFYLKNMNKQHIELNTFNNKINYDLCKLVENKDKSQLTWVCFIDQENSMFLEKIIDNFIQQENYIQIKLLFLINNYQEEFNFEKIIQKYIDINDNISYIFLNESYFINDNKKIYLSYKYSTTSYITIINPKFVYENNFSIIGTNRLDLYPTCDITVSSYNIYNPINGNIIQKFPLNMLMNKTFVNKNIFNNSGIIWRRDLYSIIENIVDLEEINDNNYNFWVKCVENNMNMVCISEIPLLTIEE